MPLTRKTTLLTVQILFCAVCIAQYVQANGLQKIPLILSNPAKFNCLNKLPQEYITAHSNTVYQYATTQLNKAQETTYLNNIADACCNRSGIANIFINFSQPATYNGRNIAFLQQLLSKRILAETEKILFAINLLNNEKQLYQQQLAQAVLQKDMFIAGIAALLLIITIGFRCVSLKHRDEQHRRKLAESELHIQKLESEKTSNALQQRAAILEMQALRAQMNPHFIFNSLNSINRFILTRQSSEASAYLARFSRLMRMILNSSASTSITLAEDIEALQLYLELEDLRCEQKFTYTITCSPEVDAEFIHIPPLLLQPFVENAIWHGLMSKEGEGCLCINIEKEDAILVCTITDDGIGRQRAATLKDKTGKYKSMGMSITETRIMMLQKRNGLNRPLMITDLVDADGNPAGTEVIIQIPVVYD